MKEGLKKQIDQIFNEATDKLDALDVTYLLLVDKDDSMAMSAKGDADVTMDMIISGLTSIIDGIDDAKSRKMIAGAYIVQLVRLASDLTKKHYNIDVMEYVNMFNELNKKGAN